MFEMRPKNIVCVFMSLLAIYAPSIYGYNSNFDMSEQIKIKFGEKIFSIPKEYFVPDLPEAFVPSKDLLDEGSEVLLDIPLQILGFSVSNDTKLSGSVLLEIDLELPYHQRGELGPSAQNAWEGEGLYDDRVIEYDKKSELYRIYPRSGYPKIWHFFKKTPAANLKGDRNWVANCMVSPATNEDKNLENVSCETVAYYKDIWIKLTLSGLHIKQINVIKKQIKSILADWEM